MAFLNKNVDLGGLVSLLDRYRMEQTLVAAMEGTSELYKEWEAVIFVGVDNRFDHPTPEILERHASRSLTVLCTDELGTIELSTDGERLWVETRR